MKTASNRTRINVWHDSFIVALKYSGQLFHATLHNMWLSYHCPVAESFSHVTVNLDGLGGPRLIGIRHDCRLEGLLGWGRSGLVLFLTSRLYDRKTPLAHYIYMRMRPESPVLWTTAADIYDVVALTFGQ